MKTRGIKSPFFLFLVTLFLIFIAFNLLALSDKKDKDPSTFVQIPEIVAKRKEAENVNALFSKENIRPAPSSLPEVKQPDVEKTASTNKPTQKVDEQRSIARKKDREALPVIEGMVDKRKAIKEGFLHAWKAYENHAFGADELLPLTKTKFDFLYQSITVVDSLSTMVIMGLRNTSHFKKARDHVLSFNFAQNRMVNFFETVIRSLGGLLSVYQLTEDDAFLQKAKELGDHLIPALNTATGLPLDMWNLATHSGAPTSWIRYSNLASVGSLQLEFTTLSKLTHDPSYEQKAKAIYTLISQAGGVEVPGLYPCFIDPHTGEFVKNERITIGAFCDSFYEYLLKLHLLENKKEQKWKEMYDQSVLAIDRHLLKKSLSGYLYASDKRGGENMEHFACFFAGLLALGAEGVAKDNQMYLAEELMSTCVHMYFAMPSGLSPDVASFDMKNEFAPLTADADKFYLRPETVESLFYFWRVTKNVTYQEIAWKIWLAIDKHCRVQDDGAGGPGGYAIVEGVSSATPRKGNKQESFFLAETLNYLYLIFSPIEYVSLDEWVFNTEAHPFKIWK